MFPITAPNWSSMIIPGHIHWMIPMSHFSITWSKYHMTCRVVISYHTAQKIYHWLDTHGLPIACQLWGVYGELCGDYWLHCVCMRILSTLTWINRLLMKNMNSKHVITLRPEYNGMQFADDIFKSIFMDERYCIFISILLQFSTQAQIDSNSALV